MEWLDSLNPALANALIFGLPVASIITGAIALFGIFDKGWKARQSEKDKLEDDVRGLYQEKVHEQDDKIENLTNKVNQLQSLYDQVSSENKTMREIFQGRDHETVEYRKRGLQTMDLTSRLAESVTNNGQKTDSVLEAIETQTKALLKLAKAIEKAVPLKRKTAKRIVKK